MTAEQAFEQGVALLDLRSSDIFGEDVLACGQLVRQGEKP
jgi:hypothetical protein